MLHLFSLHAGASFLPQIPLPCYLEIDISRRTATLRQPHITRHWSNYFILSQKVICVIIKYYDNRPSRVQSVVHVQCSDLPVTLLRRQQRLVFFKWRARIHRYDLQYVISSHEGTQWPKAYKYRRKHYSYHLTTSITISRRFKTIYLLVKFCFLILKTL